MVFFFSWVVALVLLVALVQTFLHSALAPKPTFAIYTGVAFTAPLLLLWLYHLTHDPSGWWFFGTESLLPRGLAAGAFIAAMVTALIRVSGPLSAKLLVGVLTLALWGIVWFNLTWFVACIMHECF
jgi:hypothetical protein